MKEIFKGNLANFATILGVLPIILLFYPENFYLLSVLIIYNNIMDDLDGILARELKITSKFGGNLDNLSDTVAHIVILWTVMTHFGDVVLIFGLLATISILIRVTMRLDASNPMTGGSPTNELMRHILFVYLLSIHFQIDIIWLLAVILIINSLSLVAPFDMPYMIRKKSKSVLAITLVNILLIIAWLVPLLSIIIILSFFITYIYSFGFGGWKWWNSKMIERSSLTN
ncbi:MAG: CDP-alcohol phosphatidyltransferase family protein [Candidatus Hodarchaeales archaeon]